METTVTVFTGKRTEQYSGVTDANGDLVITFTTPYQATPGIWPSANPSADQSVRLRVTAQSTTGCTIHAQKNATVTVLSIDVLGTTMTNVAGVQVRVIVMEA